MNNNLVSIDELINSQLVGKSVSIIGLGTLGTHVAQILVNSVLKLKLFDFDVVEEKNLTTQVLYSLADVNKLKAIASKESLLKINSSLDVESFPIMITNDNVDQVVSDVVIDCTDNFRVRFVLSDFCLANKISLVHGAALKDKGTVFVVNDVSLRSLYPSFECVDSCETSGIDLETAETIASLQIKEVLNILLNRPTLKGFLRVDLSRQSFSEYDASGLPEIRRKENNELVMWDCSLRNGWIVQKRNSNSIDLNKVKSLFKVVEEIPDGVIIEIDKYRVGVYSTGEVVIQGITSLSKVEEIGRLVL